MTTATAALAAGLVSQRDLLRVRLSDAETSSTRLREALDAVERELARLDAIVADVRAAVELADRRECQ